MADTKLLAAIDKLAGYIKNSTGEKQRGYLFRLALYANRAAENGSSSKAAADAEWSGTFQEALDRLTAGADELLKAQGKPYGHDGAERGALDRATYIQLATDLEVLDELGGPDFFGPEPGPGTTA